MANELAIAKDDKVIKTVEIKSLAFLKCAESLKIADQKTYDDAASLLLAVKECRVMISNLFDPQIKSAHKAHQTALAQKKRFDDPLVKADKIFRWKMSDYLVEQQIFEDEKKRKAEEEARAQQEKIQMELTEQAKRAEARGNAEAASELRQAAEETFVPAAPVQPAVEQPGGISVSRQKDYDVEVVNPMELIKALASGVIVVSDLSAIIAWKTSPLKDLAKRTDGAAIPGCEIREKKTIRTFDNFF